MAGGEELILPLEEPGCRESQLAGDEIQIFSAQHRSRTSTFLHEGNRPRSTFNFAMDTSIHEGAVCPNGATKEIVGRRKAQLAN
jgi:hypothetical protein